MSPILILLGCSAEKQDFADSSVTHPDPFETPTQYTLYEATYGSPDTGIVFPIWYGKITSIDGVFTEGLLGTLYYGLLEEDYLCEALGTLSLTGDVPTSCPDCIWTFDLVVSGTISSGTHCSDFPNAEDGAWDDFRGSFGLVENYVYSYSGGMLTCDWAVLLQNDAWGPSFYLNWWMASGNNYSAVEGDQSDVRFGRYFFDDGDVVYYYYYLW